MAIPEDRTIALRDGSTVGYYTYGAPDGAPVMALHGVPGCGAGFDWADEPARERGLLVLAPDRPGIGSSSRREGGWSVADYADIAGAFADALGLGRFGVWGYSGGGPYAVACAARLSDRVDGVVVASGMGQMGVWAKAEDFEKTDRQLIDLCVKHPWIAGRVLSTTARLARLSPKSAFKSFAKQLTDSDREVLENLGPPEEGIALFTKAFTHGPRGVVDDYIALAREWDVDLSTVTADVRVVHGDEDTMVPLHHAEALVAALPSATLTVWPGEGHLGPIRHVDEILDVFARPRAAG